MKEQAAALAIHGNTPLPMALAVAQSDAREFFESGAFSGYKKAKEANEKTVGALFARIDGVVKAVHGVGKAIHGLGKMLARR